MRGWTQDWSYWWKNLSGWKRWYPLFLLGLYYGALGLLGGFKPDVWVAAVPVVLYYGGPRVRRFLCFIFPLILTAVIYDSQRYYADFIRGPIHVSEPYRFDKYFFGVRADQGILTPNEWFQLHTHPVLDFFTGLAYLIFVPVFVGCAAYFQFWLGRKGTQKQSAEYIKKVAPQVMWAFFWVNMIGYSTYYWYAASPPWYAALYGFGSARTDIPANLAGCVRFDQLIGFAVFEQWYGRSADVHGAIPSLHIAYPLQAVLYAFHFGALRILTLLFFLLMCFSAVYLNHHYVLDILWGSAYAVAVVGVILYRESIWALFKKWSFEHTIFS
ncbi:MAG: phosphatase PAP2 family protein [Deltaproteobacteria bacterium]|nr:phosphatase PAP2 family protein [Deltaproteobacteria bacterium]